MSKLRDSTFNCAFSIWRVMMPASIGSPSGMRRRVMMFFMRSPPKMRISGSSSDR